MSKKQPRNTKGKIISAAWKLFYEQGYDDTTIDEIIAESGTSKGSFYHYLREKMPCLAPFLSFLMKNIRNWKLSWISLLPAMNS